MATDDIKFDHSSKVLEVITYGKEFIALEVKSNENYFCKKAEQVIEHIENADANMTVREFIGLSSENSSFPILMSFFLCHSHLRNKLTKSLLIDAFNACRYSPQSAMLAIYILDNNYPNEIIKSNLEKAVKINNFRSRRNQIDLMTEYIWED